MADANYPLTADEADDLPRTLRRQREELDAKARERAAAAAYGTPEPTMPLPAIEDRGEGVVVRRLDIPFLHLVTFFLKAAVAAIPAMLLIGLILWGVGHVLQLYFPQLLKMQILVWFPNNP